MAKLYKVNEVPNMFIDANCKIKEEGYISYRMVICHALFVLINEKNLDQTTIEKKIDLLFKELDEKAINDQSFFETYPVEDKLIVIIDRTDGCYPMILYKNPPKGEERISGFKAALQDVKRNIPKIYNIIKTNRFNETLHCKLEHCFTYSVPSHSQNQ
jgi:hypothetical protein